MSADAFERAFGAGRGGDEHVRDAEDRARRRDARERRRADRARREQAARAANAERFDSDGYNFDNGVFAEWPDDDGRIRLRDEDGEQIGWHDIGDPEWAELADCFGVLASDFEDDEDEDE